MGNALTNSYGSSIYNTLKNFSFDIEKMCMCVTCSLILFHSFRFYHLFNLSLSGKFMSLVDVLSSCARYFCEIFNARQLRVLTKMNS